MASHHTPLAAMGPIEWNDVPQDNLPQFLDDILSETQTVIESIPAPSATLTSGRARAKTESAAGNINQALSLRQKAESISQAQDLRKEWKEIKINPRENPIGASVYKLAAKDGRGSWFTRRSVHEGLSFDSWKKGMEIELSETMKVQGSPGSGNIRGIGADKRVEDQQVEGVGRLQVFQLSAQFPGPTAPRDFVTLLLTSESSVKSVDGHRPMRQFMIVSKPCEHAECPPRSGIIRGYYESVEVIREIPIDTLATKRSHSSVNLGRDETKRRSTVSNDEHAAASTSDVDDFPTAVEWIMATRSDPGGSVPRFLIEKGTPPGILGDAGKFLKWVTAKSMQGFDKAKNKEAGEEGKSIDAVSDEDDESAQMPTITTTNFDRDAVEREQEDDLVPSSNGLYGMISGAFGAASSLAATALSRIGATYSDVSNDSMSDAQTIEEHREDHNHEDDATSDTSSIRSFASALERRLTAEKTPESIMESQSETSKSNLTASQHDKELKKFQERRRKLDEKVAKLQQRMDLKLQGEKDKDAATMAKLREKHDREIAKQEEKYRRELRKLEEKREIEKRKAEQRKRKAQEREEKANMTMELERVRAERDLARKQAEILERQVGDLQAQVTMLVRKLGKLGKMGLVESDSSTSLKSG